MENTNSVYPNIFEVVVQNLPAVINKFRTRSMGLINNADSTKPTGSSTFCADLDAVKAISTTPTTKLVENATAYFTNVIPNTIQNNGINVINVGGNINTPAIPSVMTGSATASFVHTDWTSITDGSFEMSLGGTPVNITGLNFSAVTSMLDVVAVFNNNVSFSNLAICTFDVASKKFTFTARNASSSLTFVPLTYVASSGTDITTPTYLNMLTGAVTIVAGQDAVNNISTQLSVLKQYLIDYKTTAPFFISVPAFWWVNEFVTFLQEMWALNEYVFFTISYIGTTPTADPVFSAMDKLKNILIYQDDNNIAISINSVCALGVASQYYPSTLFRMRSLDTSNILGSTVPSLADSKKTEFATKYLSYTSLYSNITPVITVGKFQDGNIYTNRYGVATTKFYIEDVLNQTIKVLHDSNDPLAYNAKGIQTLLASIIAALNTVISWNVIESYSDLTYIPYNVYKTTYPDNVANGIYDGYSVTLQVKGFFQKIVLLAKIFI